MKVLILMLKNYNGSHLVKETAQGVHQNPEGIYYLHYALKQKVQSGLDLRRFFLSRNYKQGGKPNAVNFIEFAVIF